MFSSPLLDRIFDDKKNDSLDALDSMYCTEFAVEGLIFCAFKASYKLLTN
jgi:hypothetical protein